jgi:ABC-type branched-subunit amino acid transport system substrate-binding protein
MHPSRGALLAACAALLLTSAACNADKDGAEPDETRSVRLYGSDGNMSNSFGDEFKEKPGLLAGMKGTTPLTPLSDSFTERLLGVDPKLADYVFAAETYDAVVISAIAAQLAGTTQPKQIAKYINGVTTVGEVCDSVAGCLGLARAGRDLQYRGVSLKRGGFTDAGEPAAASYATLHFDDTDRLDNGKTEFVGAGDEAATTRLKPPSPRKRRNPADGDKPLKIGGLLPSTGDLAFMNPPMVAGARLAVAEINAAGGVFEQPVEWVDGDDGTDPAVAKRTVASHVAAGVHVIIGAGASSISTAVLPDVVAAGLILFSPCNTAAELTVAKDGGLYFRTAPSDVLQGKALADVILRDAAQKVSIVVRDDEYGRGLMSNIKTELERAGMPADQIQTLAYDPEAKDAQAYNAKAKEVKAFAPDGVVVIGFSESASLIKELAAVGLQLHH